MKFRFILSVITIFWLCPWSLAGEQPLCADKAETYAGLFAEHLRKNEVEKMEEVLMSWEESCGINEPVFRSRILLLIMQNQFPGTLDHSQIFDYAVAFDIRYELTENEDIKSKDDYYELYSEYFGYVPVGTIFDRQTQIKSAELLRRNPANEFSTALLTLYSGNTEGFFQMIKSGALKGSQLSDAYFQRVKTWQKKPEFNIAISSGLWIPTDDLEIIGIKPTLGVLVGMKINKTSIDAVFDMRFGKTRHPFEMNILDSLVETRNHQGGYIGLEVNQVLIRKTGYRIGLFASGGYNIIDIVEDRRVAQRQTFGSWAYHVGPFFEFVFPNRTHLGIKPGILFLNHKNDIGTPLKGNAFILKLLFGISENAGKTKNLQRLGY